MNEDTDTSDQKSRRYYSPRRTDQAEATQRAILQAARKRFAEQGYQATTLQAIAREAEVSVPTIYAVFGSKAAILSALVKSTGADEDIRALARDAFAEPDPWRQLRLATHVVRSIQERDTDIIDLLWQAGGGDADLAGVWRQSHQQQLARLGEIVRMVAQKQALKPELSVEEAIDTLWALGSPEIYRLLVRERNWTPQRYEDWLANTATTLLLRDQE
ncbi:MAG TPA: helix-turn-helix domain-containing protein [Ktedonobacterales bacterium]|jgi:AcrR family transcriptional regulator|nr:helix-turn-helix domain-containing protein [Ktedonobacterales bacterium]